MPESNLSREFVGLDQAAPFRATLEPYTYKIQGVECTSEFFFWVSGLPEALQKPNCRFHDNEAQGLYTYAVSSQMETGEVIRREGDNAVFCQLVAVVGPKTFARIMRQLDPACSREGCGHSKSEHATEGCTARGDCRDPGCMCGKKDKACNCKEFVQDERDTW